jgi:hypothetical protein
MRLLHTQSLARTLDAVEEALFFDETIPAAEARRVAAWLASRQGLAGAYAGMFAPTARDFGEGIRLFTGERITSGAATGHILGEEACRALRLLRVDSSEVGQALARADRSMDARLEESDTERRRRGFF